MLSPVRPLTLMASWLLCKFIRTIIKEVKKFQHLGLSREVGRWILKIVCTSWKILAMPLNVQNGQALLGLACVQTITKLWLVPSAKQRRDPCSGPPTDLTNYRKCVSNSPSTWLAITTNKISSARRLSKDKSNICSLSNPLNSFVKLYAMNNCGRLYSGSQGLEKQ